jgi:hypothetical protein
MHRETVIVGKTMEQGCRTDHQAQASGDEMIITGGKDEYPAPVFGH